MNFLDLKRNLKKETSNLPAVSVGLLGDHPTQLLAVALKGYGIEAGLNVELYEAEYNQLDFEILNPGSELYEKAPRFVWISQSTLKIWKQFCKKTQAERHAFADAHIQKITSYIEALNSRFSCTILYDNFPELDDSVFGNYANKQSGSFVYQLRKINFSLMNLSHSFTNFFVNDISALQNRVGRNISFSASSYINSSMAYSLDFLPYLAKNTIDIIQAVSGKFKKCLILDLDNTTWGGIIGDDGLEGIQIGNLGVGEAFTQLQRWAKELKERGIILAVCSKNEEEAAKSPFLHHPDMILKLEDIAVFVANWDNKAHNIQHIQSILNIGYDSMVFLDDNPAERKIIRDNLPEITVPELPEDPAEYLPYLQSLNLFETASVTAEDAERTKQYQEESKRASIRKSFVNEEEYLQSLEMKGIVSGFEKMDIPRLAQLTQRSNQFNLRTVRCTEEDIQRIADSSHMYGLSFKLSDTFGDYGLVSIVILEALDTERLLIHTWLMSCRVLKRGLEQLVLNTLVETAAMHGFKTLLGEYIPTSKNAMVKEHYPKLGFEPTEKENTWRLDVEQYAPKIHFIETA